MKTVVLIPAYKPDDALIKTVVELSSHGYDILVVDDGGGADYDDIFRCVSGFAKVLRKKKNYGKGAALKTGFRYILNRMPDVGYVVTADADGQHKTADIAKVDERLREGSEFVLGSREFAGEVPVRSRLGNMITRGVFSVVSGVSVGDTQTGLRGFDRSLLEWLVSIPGHR